MLNMFVVLGFDHIVATRGVPATQSFRASVHTADDHTILAQGPSLQFAKDSLTEKVNGMRMADFNPVLLREDEMPLAGAIQPALTV